MGTRRKDATRAARSKPKAAKSSKPQVKVKTKTKTPPAINRAWEFEEIATNVHVLRVTIEKVEQQVTPLWLADIHWDNPKCDRQVLKRHLDEALERDAPIFIIGDLFCAMQGKYDKRAHKNDIRPEHQHGDYLDRLVETAAEWFAPYKNNIVLLGYGNHETSILQRVETDLLDRLAYRLRSEGGITRTGGYDGFVRIMLSRLGLGNRDSWVGYYHHGTGGGGPVTKGAIDFNRLAEQVSADFFVMGHVHRSMLIENAVRRLSDSNRIEIFERDYVRLSTYKEEANTGHGWSVEKMLGTRPLGGKWMVIGMRYADGRAHYERRWVRV